jgi:hypothetical protein
MPLPSRKSYLQICKTTNRPMFATEDELKVYIGTCCSEHMIVKRIWNCPSCLHYHFELDWLAVGRSVTKAFK